MQTASTQAKWIACCPHTTLYCSVISLPSRAAHAAHPDWLSPHAPEGVCGQLHCMRDSSKPLFSHQRHGPGQHVSIRVAPFCGLSEPIYSRPLVNRLPAAIVICPQSLERPCHAAKAFIGGFKRMLKNRFKTL